MKTRSICFLILVFAVAGTCLTGCNTMGGLGEDLQILGQKMEQKARRSNSGYEY